MEKSYVEFCGESLEKYGDRIAYTYVNAKNTLRHMSFRLLLKNISIFRKYIKEQKLMLIFVNNNIESIVGYLSGIIEKTKVIMIRGNLHKEPCNKIVTDFKPDYLWMKTNALSLEGYSSKFAWNEYSLYEREEKSDILINEDIALLLPTSGTTGASKFVKLTYENIENNTRDIIDALMVSKESVTITSLPIYYTYGLSLINTYLVQGARVILTTLSYFQSEFWELFRREKVSSVSGVPFFY